MTIPTEPIGSIPRPLKLLDAINRHGSPHPSVEPLYDEAVPETIEQFEATGSPVVTDGEQRKYHNFATYCVEGLPNTAPDGFKLSFAAGHTRRWPRLTGGPFRFRMYGYDFLDLAMKYAHVPVKQAVISPSALSLMYPAENLPGYSREEFIEDLLGEHEKEIRGCFAKGAHKVQIDFTEGRLAVKIDPSGALLSSFIELNNLGLSRFSEEGRRLIGVHTCPGSDRDSTHSAEVDYAELLPNLFELQAGSFYIALAGEPDRTRVLKMIRQYLKPGHRIFIGVVSPIDPRSKIPKKFATASLRRRDIYRWNSLGPQMTAVFHHSATTLRPREKRRLRRFGRVWRERRWRNKLSMADRLESEDESKQLRSTLLETATSILQIRQRAEQEIRQTNEVLEQRTRELGHALMVLRATLDATADAILVTDEKFNLTEFNEKYIDMWKVP